MASELKGFSSDISPFACNSNSSHSWICWSVTASGTDVVKETFISRMFSLDPLIEPGRLAGPPSLVYCSARSALTISWQVARITRMFSSMPALAADQPCSVMASLNRASSSGSSMLGATSSSTHTLPSFS